MSRKKNRQENEPAGKKNRPEKESTTIKEKLFAVGLGFPVCKGAIPLLRPKLRAAPALISNELPRVAEI
jgi:hypothetical protein